MYVPMPFQQLRFRSVRPLQRRRSVPEHRASGSCILRQPPEAVRGLRKIGELTRGEALTPGAFRPPPHYEWRLSDRRGDKAIPSV